MKQVDLVCFFLSTIIGALVTWLLYRNPMTTYDDLELVGFIASAGSGFLTGYAIGNPLKGAAGGIVGFFLMFLVLGKEMV